MRSVKTVGLCECVCVCLCARLHVTVQPGECHLVCTIVGQVVTKQPVGFAHIGQ